MSRGNNGQDIFIGDKDRRLFLELLEEMHARFQIEMHAYVLMDNHYHLLIRPRERNLSKSMQWLGTTYTRRFNLSNKRFGHLFQGRFKNIVVENDEYLMRLSCYIHRNPLRAGIVGRLIDYRWSSYRFYGYRKKPPAWLNTESILKKVGSESPRRKYRRMVQRYSEETAKIWEDVKHGLIYGSEDFANKIKARFLMDGKNDELPQHNSMFVSVGSDELLKRGSDILDYDLENAKKSKRISASEIEKRDILIHYLRSTGLFTNRQVGRFFGLTYSSVSHRVRNLNYRLVSDKNLRRKYEKFKSQIQA